MGYMGWGARLKHPSSARTGGHSHQLAPSAPACVPWEAHQGAGRVGPLGPPAQRPARPLPTGSLESTEHTYVYKVQGSGVTPPQTPSAARTRQRLPGMSSLRVELAHTAGSWLFFFWESRTFASCNGFPVCYYWRCFVFLVLQP